MAASRSAIALALALAWSGIARAQPAPPTGTQGDRWLAPGECQATLVVESNLGVRRQFEPLSLAPDIHCGLEPRFTLGVTHSARSLSLVNSGAGLCVRGQEAGCPHTYDSTALDALALVRAGLAARARLVASSYSPFKPSLRLGALVQLRRGRAALLLDPHLQLGLANRDRGNRDELNLPVRGQLQLGSRFIVAVQTGVRGELATFGDAFAVPVGAGVHFSPAPAWNIGVEAAFPKLLGPQNTFKQRHLALFITHRFSIAPTRLEAETSAH